MNKWIDYAFRIGVKTDHQYPDMLILFSFSDVFQLQNQVKPIAFEARQQVMLTLAT